MSTFISGIVKYKLATYFELLEICFVSNGEPSFGMGNRQFKVVEAMKKDTIARGGL